MKQTSWLRLLQHLWLFVSICLFPGFLIFVYCFVLAHQRQSWSGSAACLHGSYHDICKDSVVFPDVHPCVWGTRLCKLQRFEETCHFVHYSKWYLDSCSLPLHDSHRKNNAWLHGEWQNSAKEEVTLKWLSKFYCFLTMLILGFFFSDTSYFRNETINTSKLTC